MRGNCPKTDDRPSFIESDSYRSSGVGAFGARILRLFRTRDAARHVQAHESSLRVTRLVRHPRSHRCVSSRTKTLTRKTRVAQRVFFGLRDAMASAPPETDA